MKRHGTLSIGDLSDGAFDVVASSLADDVGRFVCEAVVIEL